MRLEEQPLPGSSWLPRDPLPDALVRSSLVEVPNSFGEHPTQVVLPKKQDMVQALAAVAPEEPLADRVYLSGQMHPIGWMTADPTRLLTALVHNSI